VPPGSRTARNATFSRSHEGELSFAFVSQGPCFCSFERCDDISNRSEEGQAIVLRWQESASLPEIRSVIVERIDDERAAADQLGGTEPGSAVVPS